MKKLILIFVLFIFTSMTVNAQNNTTIYQFKVEDLLDEVLTANAADSDAIGAAGRRYVEPYSEDLLMQRFLKAMVKLEPGPALPNRIRWRFIAIRVVKFFRNLALSISRVGQEPLRHPGGDRLIY
jgi:hypothetical protein